MRIGVGGERFRLRAGAVAITFGTVLDPVPPVVTALTLGGRVMLVGGMMLVVEVADG